MLDLSEQPDSRVCAGVVAFVARGPERAPSPGNPSEASGWARGQRLGEAGAPAPHNPRSLRETASPLLQRCSEGLAAPWWQSQA